MFSSFLRLFLLVAFACHVVAEEKNEKIRHHKLKYQFGDRQPHFGYVKGHMASDHKKRHRVQETTVNPNGNNDIKLDNYVARLYVRNKLICSGLVVSNRTVLTTSLCILNVPLGNIELKLLDGTIHKIVNVTDGSEYAIHTASELVSLLILDKELPKTYIKPPPICPIYVGKSESVELWKWNNHKSLLVKKSVRQIDESECKQMIDDAEGLVINSALSCVENTRITQECEKTYGLPYVWKGHFCGLNILGHNCPKQSLADVYARLLQVKRYISRKLNEVRLSKLEDDLA
ncbi:uncharacterized protein LOC117790792 [Drosophila innubila]|uniref:uncharacterized protein LOC117790792 n=1 Tax=Drosophila innubila TaxID=198719 RepID=UPI00148B8972|nr:uncharacterized protein LOC117790792 [Drosophila innubila]